MFCICSLGYHITKELSSTRYHAFLIIRAVFIWLKLLYTNSIACVLEFRTQKIEKVYYISLVTCKRDTFCDICQLKLIDTSMIGGYYFSIFYFTCLCYSRLSEHVAIKCEKINLVDTWQNN